VAADGDRGDDHQAQREVGKRVVGGGPSGFAELDERQKRSRCRRQMNAGSAAEVSR
jgi:transposase